MIQVNTFHIIFLSQWSASASTTTMMSTSRSRLYVGQCAAPSTSAPFTCGCRHSRGEGGFTRSCNMMPLMRSSIGLCYSLLTMSSLLVAATPSVSTIHLVTHQACFYGLAGVLTTLLQCRLVLRWSCRPVYKSEFWYYGKQKPFHLEAN
jgi:hypothetical protein